jgi:hypothetical protein
VSVEEATHRGVHWRRDEGGEVWFYDDDSERWVEWTRGGDAPPLPPAWAKRGGPAGRAAWRTPWRIIPIVVVVIGVVIAVIQVQRPGGDAVKKEAAAAQALLGKCLAQHGTFQGHPKYSTKPVPCDSPGSLVKVVQVVPSSPGSPTCPAGTSGFEIPYNGVRYPHSLCVRPVEAGS